MILGYFLTPDEGGGCEESGDQGDEDGFSSHYRKIKMIVKQITKG